MTPAAQDFEQAEWTFPKEPFQQRWFLAVVFLRIVGSLFLGAFLVAGAIYAVGVFGLLTVLFLGAVYGWALFAFVHYRYLRQNEVVQMLATAAEGQQPLGSALWAHLIDRPRTSFRDFAAAVLLSVVYWGWFGRDNFDKKVRRVANMLEAGMPLHLALRRVPGVAARETILAVAVGQATGKLAPCLRRVPQWRAATVWLELLPRFVYPVLVLLLLVAVLSFQMIFIIPKFEKIFADFKMKLPESTTMLIAASRWFAKYPFVLLAGLLVFPLAALWFSIGTVRWYFPVLGRFYRLHIQSRALKMLGLLLEAGQTVPQALEVLVRSGYFWGTSLVRVHNVLDGVREGSPLPDQLHRQGLLPRSMMPLLHSAEKANNLPWALSEMGDHLARQGASKAQRFVMTIFPLCIVALGLLIGFIVLSMFMPLIQLINSLGN